MPQHDEPFCDEAPSQPLRDPANHVRGVPRRIDHLGRIVIPVEYRRVLGIRDGDELDLSLVGDTIAIRRADPGCSLCHNIVALRQFRTHWICEDCRTALATP